MERAAVGGGGVAVRTSETDPVEEQLATQPPLEIPLQAAKLKETTARSRAVGARRMGSIGITPFVNSALPATWRGARVCIFSGAARPLLL